MKKYLILMIMAILVIGLIGCRGSNDPVDDPTGKVTISYWNPLTGADGVKMRQLVNEFNADHEGEIEVTETYTNEISYYENLNYLVPINRGPDVAIMHSYLVQSYANRGIIMPLESYLETSEVDINSDDYITDVFNSLYFDSKLYGIPLDIHVVGIYYNKSLLTKYNLQVPTNRSELILAAKTVQEGEKLLGKTVWGLPISSVWPSEWIYTTALYQNGGLELDSQGNPGYDTAQGRLAMKMVADMVHVHNISPANLGLDQDLFYFQTNQALFHIQGCWMLNSIIESGVNFGVLPMSKMFTDESTSNNAKYIAARSHTFVLPKTNKTVSDAKKTAIITFIKYLGDHSYIWATAGQIPASHIARRTDEYKALTNLNGFGEVDSFKVAAQSPYYHEAYSPIYSRVTSALLNKDYNADTLIKAAVEEATKLIQEAKG